MESSKAATANSNGEHCIIQRPSSESLSSNPSKINDHKMIITIPDGAEQLPFQIAGHCFGKSKHKWGILKHSQSGDILKPIFDKRSHREQLFYENIINDDDNDKDNGCLKILQKLVPHYNGLFHDDHMNIDYIRLEDITAHMINISLLDVKIGYITYDPEASEEKRRAEMSKYKYAKDLGFRILGMRYFDSTTNEFVDKNREYGLQITPDNASSAFLLFAQNDPNILQQFDNQLSEIEHWFTKHNIRRWKFLSSSILFACGEKTINTNINNDDGHNNNKRKTIVKMIDFAHVFPNDDQELDENYLFGLGKLRFHITDAIKICEQQQQQQSK
ncbi:inositol polyphosphate multikinase [Dermatophagoides farinae]|uniref:Kinase n=1 Tax=Dermatophagoides farinae TaxID=6954 RepID=A0A9D4NS94_DERFA|nr:inositol polyphosphate multikinase-like [Dermatophagoides farinae]KAH7638096.1 inositol polyphosphate multikinase-like protein [Dermatophagoides farinae]